MPPRVQLPAHEKTFLSRIKPLGLELRRVQRPGELAQGLFAAVVVIEFEVAAGQLPEGSVYRLPVAQAAEMRLGHGAPAPVLDERGYHVVVVARVGAQVQQERAAPMEEEGGGGEHRPFYAVGLPLLQALQRGKAGIRLSPLEVLK